MLQYIVVCCVIALMAFSLVVLLCVICRIKRYTIEKVTTKKAPAATKYARPDEDDEDDLYDF